MNFNFETVTNSVLFGVIPSTSRGFQSPGAAAASRRLPAPLRRLRLRLRRRSGTSEANAGPGSSAAAQLPRAAWTRFTHLNPSNSTNREHYCHKRISASLRKNEERARAAPPPVFIINSQNNNNNNNTINNKDKSFI